MRSAVLDRLHNDCCELVSMLADEVKCGLVEVWQDQHCVPGYRRGHTGAQCGCHRAIARAYGIRIDLEQNPT
jgi:hypothetical protein